MKDVLLVTWHGIHELEIYPGLPDTGGQNIYVQNMAQVIHDVYHYRVTVLNRGGYPHPYTGRMRNGYTKDPARELFVLHAADAIGNFVRKEYLTPALIENAVENTLQQLPPDYDPDIIVSHFWDGGIMGQFLQSRFPRAVHVWVPHEPVGIKQAPLSASHYDRHSIELRLACERRVMERAGFVGSTSKLVRDDLDSHYRGAYNDKVIDIFPGVDTTRFRPAAAKQLSPDEIKTYAGLLAIPESALRVPHICEFGRSDSLKRKEKAVEAFARVCRTLDDLVMFTNVDAQMEPSIAEEIDCIIETEGIRDRVFILSPKQLPQSGPGSTILPDLMRTARVFLTMSEMEGFGMAACEAAACAVPVVGTDQIPVLTDVIAPAGGGRVVAAGDSEAAAQAVGKILRMTATDYAALCNRAFGAVIPGYTWSNIISRMFEQIRARGVELNGNGKQNGRGQRINGHVPAAAIRDQSRDRTRLAS